MCNNKKDKLMGIIMKEKYNKIIDWFKIEV